MIELVQGVWQFSARHPEWTEQDGDEDGWEPDVAWWAWETEDGVVLIDPLVDDWAVLDALVERRGEAVIVRTCHWHQRSIPEVAARYGAPVWAAAGADGATLAPCDRILADSEQLPGGGLAVEMERDDEIALWLERPSALVFGDAMLRDPGGRLRVCPESWTQPPGGRKELLVRLRGLERLRPRHVLVSHGPLVTGDGSQSLTRALEAASS
jgi:glyoxylase-like metal-dependent hydrolase (beta-lactamase superfamily II)